MLRSCKTTVRTIPKVTGVFSVDDIERIIKGCDNYKHAIVYKGIYLLAFHAFLRISNIAAINHNSFDYTRNLSRGDVIVNRPYIHVIIKWSKTLQSSDQHHTIPITEMKNHRLCPVLHLCNYLESSSGSINDPLFAIKVGNNNVTVSHVQIRRHLRLVLRSINIDPSTHGFHTFRRSAATLAQSVNVNYESIQPGGRKQSTHICAIHLYRIPFHWRSELYSHSSDCITIIILIQ